MRTLFILISSAILAGAAAAPASAAFDQVHTSNDNIRYACTGIGIGSRDNPQWSRYSTKLEFAAKNGDYLGNVRINVDSASGKDVLSAHCDAPWLVADLPSGHYDVNAVAQGDHGQYDRSVNITVGQNGQTTRVIHFPSITE